MICCAIVVVFTELWHMETFWSFCKSFLLFLGISQINNEDFDLDELEQELDKLNIGKILTFSRTISVEASFEIYLL